MASFRSNHALGNGCLSIKVDDGDSRTFSQGNSGTDLWMGTLAMTVSLLFWVECTNVTLNFCYVLVLSTDVIIPFSPQKVIVS